jgi:hypothetical protein
MIRTLALGAAVVVVLAAAAVAGASNGTKRIVVDRAVYEYSFVAVDCSDFGSYDFSILADGMERVKITDVVASDGTVLETIFDIVLDETDTNTVSGRSLPLRGTVHEVFDWGSNTRTLTGAIFIGRDPGEGLYVQDTGRITITLDTRVAEFAAGPHEAFFGGGIEAVLCAGLADA